MTQSMSAMGQSKELGLTNDASALDAECVYTDAHITTCGLIDNQFAASVKIADPKELGKMLRGIGRQKIIVLEITNPPSPQDAISAQDITLKQLFPQEDAPLDEYKPVVEDLLNNRRNTEIELQKSLERGVTPPAFLSNYVSNRDFSPALPGFVSHAVGGNRVVLVQQITPSPAYVQNLTALYQQKAAALDEATKKAAQAEALSLVDPRTGLPNDRSFTVEFARMLKHVSTPHEYRRDKDNKRTGLMIGEFDLRKLKVINDNLGENAGDALLQKMGQVLQEAAREDISHVARVGGDEFGFITEIKSKGEATETALRIGKILANATCRIETKKLSEEWQTLFEQRDEDGNIHKTDSAVLEDERGNKVLVQLKGQHVEVPLSAYFGFTYIMANEDIWKKLGKKSGIALLNAAQSYRESAWDAASAGMKAAKKYCKKCKDDAADKDDNGDKAPKDEALPKDKKRRRNFFIHLLKNMGQKAIPQKGMPEPVKQGAEDQIEGVCLFRTKIDTMETKFVSVFRRDAEEEPSIPSRNQGADKPQKNFTLGGGA